MTNTYVVHQCLHVVTNDVTQNEVPALSQQKFSRLSCTRMVPWCDAVKANACSSVWADSSCITTVLLLALRRCHTQGNTGGDRGNGSRTLAFYQRAFTEVPIDCKITAFRSMVNWVIADRKYTDNIDWRGTSAYRSEICRSAPTPFDNAK